MTTDKTYDIVVYGATGFTGQLIAEYLSTRADEASLSWAIAGRSEDKLERVRDQLPDGSSPGLIVADARDADAVRSMVTATGLVIAVAGPYIEHGEPIVAACAEAGTDYVDLAGEANFIRLMADRYQDTASASGARILSSCGFDSLPSDVGVFRLQSTAIERFGAPAGQVKGRVTSFEGGVSGGTIASIFASMASAEANPEEAEILASPFGLTPGFDGPAQPDARSLTFDEEFDSWASPFIMGPVNTQNVHRTNFLLGHRFGADFRYSEMLSTGPGDDGRKMAEALAASGGIDMSGGDVPQPGEGPSKEVREAGHFTLRFVGQVGPGQDVAVEVSGFQDPGYGCTSKMISEAALELRTNRTTPGGMWSPAAALGDGLIDRLVSTGVLAVEVDPAS